METFVNFSELLHHRPETRFPEHNSAASLAKDFTAFFRNKIRRIREDLSRSKPNNVLEFRCVAAKCQFIIFAIISPTKPVATVGSMFFVNLSMESGILLLIWKWLVLTHCYKNSRILSQFRIKVSSSTNFVEKSVDQRLNCWCFWMPTEKISMSFINQRRENFTVIRWL